MADPLKQWLAQMPSDDVIDVRISELETELAVWQTLRTQRPRASTPSREGIRAPRQDASMPAAAVKAIRPLSPERLLIAKAMNRARNATATPHDVGMMLRADGHSLTDKNIQVTLMRMLKANQVRRLRKGTYKLVPEVRELLRADQEPIGHGNGRVPEAVMSS